MVLVTKYTCQNEVDVPNTNKSALFVDCSGILKIMDDTWCVREISCGYDHCVAYPRVQILVVGAWWKGSSSCTALCAWAGWGGWWVYYNPSYELCEDTYCIYVWRWWRRLLLNQWWYWEPSIFWPGTTWCAYIYAWWWCWWYSIEANSCRRWGNWWCVALNAYAWLWTCYEPVYYYWWCWWANPSNNYIWWPGWWWAFGNAETIADCCVNRYGWKWWDGFASEISWTLEYYWWGWWWAAYNYWAPQYFWWDWWMWGWHWYDCINIDLEPTSYGWGGWGWNLRSWCLSWNWYNWVIYIRYRTDGSDWIVCAEWWTVYCCCWYTIHRFNYICNCCQQFNITCKKVLYYK